MHHSSLPILAALKRFLHPSWTAATLFALASASAPALTVPVAEDTYSTKAHNLNPLTGDATTLTVTAEQAAFVRFNIFDHNVIPTAIVPGNIVAARLRLYLRHATKDPSALTVSTVTTPWTEVVAPGKTAVEPTIGSVVATIPETEVVGKNFVEVDVTAALKAALAGGTNDYGFAIEAASASNTVVYLASKEGPGLGESAVLEIETNLAEDGSGNETVTGNATIDGALSVSSVFVVQPRPNNAPATPSFFNTFIGGNAGVANTIGDANIFIGTNAGASNVGGFANVFEGFGAGAESDGDYNSFYGFSAGQANTTGNYNNFFGGFSGNANAGGSGNNFFGYLAGADNVSGGENTYIGDQAGKGNAGNDNVYIGANSGFAVANATENVFIGFDAGQNDTGSYNAFVGWGAGQTNVTGSQDCYFGVNAGNLATGSYNCFFGAGAGQNTSTGFNNTFMGNVAGFNNTAGINNTVIGGDAGQTLSTTESGDTYLGSMSEGVAGINNATAVGNQAKVTASNALVLGSVSGVNGATATVSVGIGVTAPNSTLQVNGSLSLPIRVNTTSILVGLTYSDYVVINEFNGAGILLPISTGNAGRVYVVKNKTTAATIGTQGSDAFDTGVSTLDVGNNTIVNLITDGAGTWYKIN